MLLAGSSSNLLLAHSLMNPTKLSEYIEPCIECFFDVCIYDEESINIQYSHKLLSIFDIKFNFANIIYIAKNIGFDLIRPYSHTIQNIMESYGLDHFFALHFGLEDPFARSIINEFNAKSESLNVEDKKQYNELFSFLMDLVDPMSKWIYKIPDDKLLKKFIAFILKIYPTSRVSSDVFIKLTHFLLRLVKPKRILYNKENGWYWTNCLEICDKLKFVYENIINYKPEEIDFFVLCRYFEGYIATMLIYIYTNFNEGHKFFKEVVVKSYKENKEANVFKMIELFIKMAKFNYFNDEEINIMIDVVDDVIKIGNFYCDPFPTMFDFLTNLIEIRKEICVKYIDLCIEKFNLIKNDFIHKSEVIHFGNFLLTTFNVEEKLRTKISPFLNDIMKTFPFCKGGICIHFWHEIQTFIEYDKKRPEMKEHHESIIYYFINFFSYEQYMPIFFNFEIEEIENIKKYFEEMIDIYKKENPTITLENILFKYLPHQPSSIEYILSILSNK